MKPGPRRLLRPALPKRFGAGAAKDAGSNQNRPRPAPFRYRAGATTSAKLLFPGQLQAVASATGVKGVPLTHRRIPFNCQPPIIQAAGPFLAKAFPGPNGSSYRWLVTNMWVRSYPVGP